MIFPHLALLPLCAALAFAADAGERRFDCTVVAIHDDASLGCRLPGANKALRISSTPSSYRPPSPGVGAPGSPERHAARQIGDHPRARPRRALPHPRRGLGDPGRLPHLRTYPGCRAGPADHWPGQLARRAGQRPDGRGARPVPVRRGRSAGAQGWPVGSARRRSYRWISANLMPSPRSSPDRVVEPAERHHLVALVDQEITAPAVLLEEHDPFLARVGLAMMWVAEIFPAACLSRTFRASLPSRQLCGKAELSHHRFPRRKKTQRAAIAISMPGTASSRRMLRISHSVSGGALSCGEGMVRAT